MNDFNDNNKNELNKAWNICIRLLGFRARSVKEIQDHLKKKNFTSEIIKKTTEKLINDRILDDKEFASAFVENRERFRPKSKFALTFELRRKGINDRIIDDVLKNIDESQSAWAAVKPKLCLWNTFDKEKFKKKIINYLKNRGFSYDISLSTCDRCWDYIVNYQKDKTKRI